MKITISCDYGAIRPIRLAEQLDDLGYLHELYVPHDKRQFPYYILKKFFGKGSQSNSVSPLKVRTNLLHAFGNELLGDYKFLPHLFKSDNRFFLSEIADKSVARRFDKSCDILLAQSTFALHTIREAKKHGIITVLDRTNSHINYQTKILRDEYKKFGFNYINDQRLVNKSLLEYEEADHIFVLSSFVKNTFVQEGIDSKKLCLIPSGISFSSFKNVQKKDNVFRIVYCGAINLKKGVHYLLKAFSELSIPNSELLLIGPVSEEMKSILNEYRGHYKLLKYVPNDLMYKHYSSGSVFVLPSIEEGLAKVILEAMACGLPVIATENTGARDVIRDGYNGFIVPIRDVKSLEDKISFIYKNEKIRVEMGRRARMRIKDNFTLEKYADRVVETCKSILRDKDNKKHSNISFKSACK